MEVNWEPVKSDLLGVPRCLKRIQKDISDIVNNPPQGIFALPDEDNVRLMTVLIAGPKDTPYQGGMFTVNVVFTDDYPIKPPKVRFMTTDEDTVRFNPNIYANGKVCLSILGTFRGPSWAPAMNLSSVVVSIQSLLNEEPYRNEPGYENASKQAVKNYNDVIQHETIRVAVIDAMEKKNSLHGKYFVEKMNLIFNENYDHYVKVCNDNLHLEGKTMKVPIGERLGTFRYKKMLGQLQWLKKIHEKKCKKK